MENNKIDYPNNKMDYTNLERLKSLCDFANEVPELLARYLKGFDFCAHPEKCCNRQVDCESCIENWLNDRAEQ